MPPKLLASAVASVLTVAVYIPYFWSILYGKVRPHVFSWVIWGLTTLLVFGAQLQDRGGPGAWPIGLTGLITLGVAGLAWWRRGDRHATRGDWIFFGAALSSLPVWALTADPTLAVVILTTVDLLGFGPTLRKAWDLPYEESVLFYLVFPLRNALAVLALEHYSWATVLFPVATGLACLPVVAVLLWRRKTGAGEARSQGQ